MPETRPSEKKAPIHERVARKFSFLNTAALILLFIAILASVFK